MTGMWTMISRLGCCRTRHRPGSSFSFSAATLKRAACDSQGFFSCSSVSVVSIKILRRSAGLLRPCRCNVRETSAQLVRRANLTSICTAAEWAQGKPRSGSCEFPFIYQRSHSAAELINFAAIAFRRSAFGRNLKLPHRLALGCQLGAQLPALIRLAIERLRNRGGAAHLAEEQDLDMEIASGIGHVQ